MLRMQGCSRPMSTQTHPSPMISRLQDTDGQTLRGDFRDTLYESSFSKISHTAQLRAASPRHSVSTSRDSPSSSKPNSTHDRQRPSLPSTNSVNVSIDIAPNPKTTHSPRRLWVLSRLKSSIDTSGVTQHSTRRPSVQSLDFSIPPEEPEKHFIDSIGMVIPGVCNQNQCARLSAHFIANWRLCEPIEYTTPLAEHGITFSDYGRVLAALANFLNEIPNEAKQKAKSGAPRWHLQGWQASVAVSENISKSESAQQHKKAAQQAAALNKLLGDISWSWQRRGLPVMMCVSSYSLFAPNRISESFVQILHAPLQASPPTQSFTEPWTSTSRLSFIEPFVIAKEERSLTVSRHKPSRRSISPPMASNSAVVHHHHQLNHRDRTRPWPLWPNAIPSRKRDLMNGHADRYGVDPYFRAWIRANINSRTRCTSYAKYMIEQEDNPFINTRLEYVTPTRRALPWNLLTMWSNQLEGHYPSTANRTKYEHNRRLECRKTVERGYRLRIASFGFRHPIYPLHTPEMEELGLTLEAYHTIIDTIEGIRQNYKPNANEFLPHYLDAWSKLRRRGAEDAMVKVSEYMRQVNALDRRVVWTIEKIPGVYDRGLGKDREEWEISLWNGEDPLELLIQLERWGIIEKKFNMEDDEGFERPWCRLEA